MENLSKLLLEQAYTKTVRILFQVWSCLKIQNSVCYASCLFIPQFLGKFAFFNLYFFIFLTFRIPAQTKKSSGYHSRAHVLNPLKLRRLAACLEPKKMYDLKRILICICGGAFNRLNFNFEVTGFKSQGTENVGFVHSRQEPIQYICPWLLRRWTTVKKNYNLL